MVYIFSLALLIMSLTGIYEIYTLKHIENWRELKEIKKKAVDKSKLTYIQVISVGINLVYMDTLMKILVKVFVTWLHGRNCTGAVIYIVYHLALLYSIEEAIRMVGKRQTAR